MHISLDPLSFSRLIDGLNESARGREIEANLKAQLARRVALRTVIYANFSYQAGFGHNGVHKFM